MNIGDRILIKSNHKNTVEFHRGYICRVYTIKPVDDPRIFKMTEGWPGLSGFDEDGWWTEYHISDRELEDGFFTPNLEPDPLQSYWDYRETMDDFIESTRS